MEKCYPLILKAQMEDEDETENYTQATAAERLRFGQVQVEVTKGSGVGLNPPIVEKGAGWKTRGVSVCGQ